MAGDTAEPAYAAAGVDIAAGERAVDLMKAHVATTRRPEVMSELGGFAGCFDARGLAAYRHPVLVTSTDGVGTKVAIASALGVYDTVGIDLVGMLVDDLVVVGAEPLFVTDYIACGAVHPERIAAIVKGIAAGCVQAGAALLGGETAEHPGLLGADEFDLAGATTGVVEADAMLGPDKVRSGDRVVALASSGLHSNGYSLVRHVIRQAGLSLDTIVPDFGRTLGEELLTPTRVYASACLDVIRTTEVHALSHITGGGLANNLARVVPAGLTARLDRGTWTPPPVFGFIQALGQISQPDIEATLNQGVGMCLMCPPASVRTVVDQLATRGIHAWEAGEVAACQPEDDRVTLTGRHP